MKISKLLTGRKTLEQYADEKDITSDLAKEMNRYIPGASVFKNKIVYGNKTRKGCPIVITLQINEESDRNKVKVDFNVETECDQMDYPKVLKDTSWMFKKMEDVRNVASDIGRKIKKTLMKW